MGVAKGTKVAPLGPRASGVTKPVVFYGTSITHGGCASRPGMAWVNIAARKADVPAVNLGFSGSGKMEFDLAAVVARIDASCYVLDCLHWDIRTYNGQIPALQVEVYRQEFLADALSIAGLIQDKESTVGAKTCSILDHLLIRKSELELTVE